MKCSHLKTSSLMQWLEDERRETQRKMNDSGPILHHYLMGWRDAIEFIKATIQSGHFG